MPPGNQWIPSIQTREQRPGPVPVQHRQGEVDAADQPRLVRGGRRDDLPGPGQVRRRHHQGPAARSSPSSTRPARPRSRRCGRPYKSDASSAGIDINLVGQTFNTIIGESAPCCADGPEVQHAGVRLRRLGLRRPGLRADRRAAVRDRRRVELRQLLRPDDGQADHTRRTPAAACRSSTSTPPTRRSSCRSSGMPNRPYSVQAVSSKLHGVTFNPLYTLLPEYWYFTK